MTGSAPALQQRGRRLPPERVAQASSLTLPPMFSRRNGSVARIAQGGTRAAEGQDRASSMDYRALPALPIERTVIEASDNTLAALPEMPQTPLAFEVSNNQLTDLLVLPPEQHWLNTQGNRSPVTFYRPNCISEARRWQEDNPPRTTGNASLATTSGATAVAILGPGTGGNPNTALPLLLPSAAEADTTSLQRATPESWTTGGRMRLPPLQSTESWAELLSRMEYDLSVESARPRGASFPARTHAVGARVAPRSENPPDALVFSSGRFPGENAGDFNGFIARLRETSDFTNPSHRTRMIARVNSLISGMRSAPVLRDICFGIATQAIESCSDRIAQGLGDMERAKMNHDVQVQNHPIEELLSIGQGLFKLKMLDEIAAAEIEAQRRNGGHMDEIEIRLAYHVGLRDRLAFPEVAQSMRYAATANLGSESLAQAEAMVRHALTSSACVNFLVHWAPWQNALERNDADGSYERVRYLHQRERDSLSIQPAEVTEGEWIEELDGIQERQEVEVSRITRRMTREVLALKQEILIS